MKVIEASVQEIKQGSGIKAIYQHIEKCGRTCYKSEDKITEDSAMKFFQGLVKRKHFAMLEHGTVYLRIPYFLINDETIDMAIHKIRYSKYSFTIFDYADSRGTILYITTNMRVLVEEIPNEYNDILRNFALEEPSTKHIKRLTAKFIISRGIANEFVRHRVFSFAQESTRYCNYMKDKFGGELTFIRPEWLKGDDPDEWAESVWFSAMERAEEDYYHLVELNGVKPQNARGVLPLDLKTELIMTGTLDQWEAFWDLRMREITGPAHPDAKAIAEEWYNIVNP